LSETCFKEIWRKYMVDERVSRMLKRIGPAFPQPGPHYNYVDLVEHIRHSLYALCMCNPDELPEYHLPEIFERRRKLSEEVSRYARAGFLREEDYQYYLDHVESLISNWEKDFKRYFSRCVIGGG